ncbi:MAG TPA: flagellar basal body L-ring protein FlgH [Candidatus Latescibacteria bacterium]|nr:flagellar basal body L-ring protein FlgH [Candidatus Latescibacterota bacterium]
MWNVFAVLVLLWTAQPCGEVISLFSDHRARRIGDVLTVLIVEQSSASSETKSSAKKSGGHSFSTTAGQGPLSFIPLMGASEKHSVEHQGDASVFRKGELKARVTVRVVGNTENGDLVVRGVRKVEVNGDREEIVITGVVRPEDISSDNTVYSYQIADLRISYKGKGPYYRGQRMGILGWLLGWLF